MGQEGAEHRPQTCSQDPGRGLGGQGELCKMDEGKVR